MSRRPRAVLVLSTALLLTVSALLAPFAGLPLTRPVLAADWQPTGLTEDTFRLFAPASGALFAATFTRVMRSDDGGASWHQVNLPAGLSDEEWRHNGVAVDPNDHTRVYVGNWATRDDGATWSKLDEQMTTERISKQGSFLMPAPSGADPDLIYLALADGSMGTGEATIRRSRDGGASWDTVLHLDYSDFSPSSSIGITLFAAHPSDPNVVFQSIVGFRGRGNQGVLRRSDDQGQTWKEVLFEATRMPYRMVGGQGANLGRFYVAMASDDITSTVFKSDDGGVTWTESAPLGESALHQRPLGLAFDPNAPDRVWVAPKTGSIQASEDAGKSWTEVSPADWEVSNVALGVDGANLYAATKRGVYRLPLR